MTNNIEDIINLNYPLLSNNRIQMENRIKQQMRNMSLNFPEERDFERYTDKFIQSISYEAIRQSLNIELLSPELLRKGIYNRNDFEIYVGEEFDDENGKDFSENNNEMQSDQDNNDYIDNYFDEDDFVNEKESNNRNDEVF